MKRILLVLLVCAVVGALVALGMHALLRNSTGFLADNRTAVIGGVAGAVSVVVVNAIVPRRRAGK